MHRSRSFMLATLLTAAASIALAQAPSTSSGQGPSASSAQAPSTGSGQGSPEIESPPSPMGHAATQLGGTWTKTAEGNPTYTGGKWITVDYSRPILRGRMNIFGSGAEYGKAMTGDAPLWRAGANASTRLTTQVPLLMAGKTIPPGVYGVLVDLKPGAWSLVISGQTLGESFDPKEKTKLYGAANYDATQDVVRVPMKVMGIDLSVDQFTIGFINVTDKGGSLAMWWDKTMAVADFTVGPAS